MTHSARLVVTLSFLAAAPHICRAEFIFLGPTPYKSAADSPFPVDGSNPNFFLEDFEDGLFNVPGVTWKPMDPLATIVGPSPTTDSVDSDDGFIDGSGTSGRALRQRMAPDLVSPPLYSAVLQLIVDSQLGHARNAFGFVWTDSPAPTTISIFILDDGKLVAGKQFTGPFGDSSETGATNEDRFFGVISSTSFTKQTISVSANFQSTPDFPALPLPNVEFDHLQFGHMEVPEPQSTGPIVFAVINAIRRKMGRRRT